MPLTVAISSSLKNKELIKQMLERGTQLGYHMLFPNLETEKSPPEETVSDMQKLLQDQFEVIEQADIVYVIWPNGYIGKSVSLEIGYAVAHKKKIIYSEKPEDLVHQAVTYKLLDIENLNQLKDLI